MRKSLLLWLVLCGLDCFAQPPTRVKLGTALPSGTSYHKILLAMGEAWRKAPGGGADLIVHPGGALGGEADMVRRMRLGTLDAAVLTANGLSEVEPSVTALQSIPMMFRNMEEVEHVGSKLRPGLEKRLLDKGFVVLFWGNAGWVRFFSKEAITRPADLKRMKVFTWAGDAHAVDIYKASGYQPVSLETADILPGLRTGLITVIPTVPFVALASLYYTAAPHMLDLNWAPLVGATIIARKSWEKFPAPAREAMTKAAAEAGGQMEARGRAENDQAVVAMKKNKLIVHPATADAEAEWRRTAEAVYPRIRGAVVPVDMFDEVVRVLAEYRAGPRK